MEGRKALRLGASRRSGRTEFRQPQTTNGGWCRHQPPLSRVRCPAWVQQRTCAQAFGVFPRGRSPMEIPFAMASPEGLAAAGHRREIRLPALAEAFADDRASAAPHLCNILASLPNSACYTGFDLGVSNRCREEAASALNGRSHANPSRCKRNLPVDKKDIGDKFSGPRRARKSPLGEPVSCRSSEPSASAWAPFLRAASARLFSSAWPQPLGAPRPCGGRLPLLAPLWPRAARPDAPDD